MKRVLILFLITIQLVNAQEKEINGVILDSETLQPIEFATISIKNDAVKNATGSISNEIGEFSLLLKDNEVTFSHVNFKSYTTKLSKGFNEIILEPKIYVLDEIVISTLTPKEYLKKIIKDSDRKLDKNTLLKSYCREIVRINKEFTKFSDALVDYYVKKGNGKSTLLLKEHRAFAREKIESEEKLNLDAINSAFKLKDYVKSAYKFDELEKILKNDEYSFERLLRKEANGAEYEFIEIIPNINSEDMLSTGYVIVDHESQNILEYKIYTSKNHLKNAKLINLVIAKAKVNSFLKWSKFKIINDQYILIYNKRDVEMFIKMGKKVEDDFSFTSDLFVYNFLNNVEIPKKGYKGKTIFEAGTNYNTEFWKKHNAFPLTENQQNFINSAQVKN